MGVTGQDVGAEEAGAVFVLLGPIDEVAGLGGADVVLDGPDTKSYFGTAIASQCDLDGDGYADLVASAPGGGMAAVYVLTGPDVAAFSLAGAWALFSGSSYFDIGASLQCLPPDDANGPVLLVGAPGYDYFTGSDSGAMFVFRALSSGTTTRLTTTRPLRSAFSTTLSSVRR